MSDYESGEYLSNDNDESKGESEPKVEAEPKLEPENIEKDKEELKDEFVEPDQKPEPEPKKDPPRPVPASFRAGRTEPDMSTWINMLLPIFTNLLNSSGSASSLFSGLGNNNKVCPAEELVKQFNSIWDGLDRISDDKVRAICFMDRLNKFHERLWAYARSNAVKDVKGTFATSALDMTEEKFHKEISNVMSQLTH